MTGSKTAEEAAPPPSTDRPPAQPKSPAPALSHRSRKGGSLAATLGAVGPGVKRVRGDGGGDDGRAARGSQACGWQGEPGRRLAKEWPASVDDAAASAGMATRSYGLRHPGTVQAPAEAARGKRKRECTASGQKAAKKAPLDLTLRTQVSPNCGPNILWQKRASRTLASWCHWSRFIIRKPSCRTPPSPSAAAPPPHPPVSHVPVPHRAHGDPSHDG
jgi:hypothetical protein